MQCPPIPLLTLFLPLFCLLFLEQILGSLIVVTSAVIKFPQIFNVLRSKSAKGLSMIGFEAELLAYSFTFSYGLHYNLPFSGYGESLLMAAQDVILIASIYYFEGATMSRVILATGSYAAILTVLLSGSLGDAIMKVGWMTKHFRNTDSIAIRDGNTSGTKCDYSLRHAT